MRLLKITILGIVLHLSAISTFGQVHFVQKGGLKLGLKVTLDDQELPIENFCEGFDPVTGIPLYLEIPDSGSLSIIPDSLGETEVALIIDDEAPILINGPSTKFTGNSISASPDSEFNYKFIDVANLDTLEISWSVGYVKPILIDLFPSKYLKDYVLFQIKNWFLDYPDTSQFDWKNVDYIKELDERGLPVSPSFPYSDNGLFFGVDRITENIKIQLVGFHNEPQSLNEDDPFALFLYEDLKPGDYEFIVWAYENSPDKLNLRYRFSILNPWWKEPLAIAGFIVIGILAIGITIFLGYRSSYKRKTRELQWAQKLTQAELKAIRAQLNPHFLFNSLNSIQNLVSQKKNELASAYIQKLSKFLRKVLSISEKQFHELEEEIELTELYLELERLRYPFSLEITISKELPQGLLVPVMLLQPYVENAVKHGVASMGEQGKISIKIEKSGGFLQVDIRDNGPGLNIPQDSSVGLKLGDARIKNLNHVYSGDASVSITNQKDPTGVLVRISLPLEL